MFRVMTRHSDAHRVGRLMPSSRGPVIGRDCYSSHADGSTIISRLFHESAQLGGYIAKAIRHAEATLVSEIVEAIDPDLLAQWKRTITLPSRGRATVQNSLWAAPAKHSTRQDPSGVGAGRTC